MTWEKATVRDARIGGVRREGRASGCQHAVACPSTMSRNLNSEQAIAPPR